MERRREALDAVLTAGAGVVFRAGEGEWANEARPTAVNHDEITAGQPPRDTPGTRRGTLSTLKQGKGRNNTSKNDPE